MFAYKTRKEKTALGKLVPQFVNMFRPSCEATGFRIWRYRNTVQKKGKRERK